MAAAIDLLDDLNERDALQHRGRDLDALLPKVIRSDLQLIASKGQQLALAVLFACARQSADASAQLALFRA